MTDRPQPRAQVGVGTLVVFVTMVLVASIAAGVLINTIGLGGGPAADPANSPAADGILVISETGERAADGSVGVVHLTVTTAPGAEEIDLQDATVTWVGPNGAYSLASAGTGGGDADGTFAVSANRDPSGSAPVLDEASDRMILTIDVGESEVDGVEAFGADLQSGDMVVVTLTTSDGVSTSTRLAVPRSTANGGLVGL